MSWWDSSKGFSSFSQALKTAQSKIDQVLDIQDKGGPKLSSSKTNSSDISSTPTETSLKSEPGVLAEESWNSWLGSDAVGFGGVNWGNSQFLKSKKTSSTPVQSISKQSSNNAPTLDIGKTNDGSTNKTVSRLQLKKSSIEEVSEYTKSVEERCTSETGVIQNTVLSEGVEIITDKEIITTEKKIPALSEEEGSKLSPADANKIRQLSGGGTSVKKGAPLKLSIKPKSKGQVEKKDEDRKEKVNEMLKREKEAELQLMEMLGNDEKKLLHKSGSTNAADAVAKKSENKEEKDIIEPKEMKEQEKPPKTLANLTSEMNTGTIDINIAHSDWGDAGLLIESQIDGESNALMMQSQNSNWGEAKMLTESQIMNISVDDNKQNYLAEKSEITNETQLLSNISGTEDPEVGKQLDESALEVEKIQTAQYETDRTVNDMKKDENIGPEIKNEISESKFISEVPQDIGKIHQQDSINQDVITAKEENIVEENETDGMIAETISKYTDTISETANLNSEDIAADLSAKLDSTELKCDNTQDGGSIISTLDGSSTSETVDELSSSNQTLTADDFQSSVTSNKSSDKEIESETVIQVEKSPADCDNKMDIDNIIEDKLNTVRQDSESNVSERVSSDTHDIAISDVPGDQDLIKTRSSTEDFVQSVENVRSSQSEGNANQTQNMTESHSSQCSSSSYVKNMLEEAMVESIKDLDSRSDCVSHSSSDMVRIESDQNSGHTSGDDLETAASSITSSDIEIISHISTPTPNGENRGFVGVSLERPFDLSPLRQALNKAVRRNSPPGHKRSDSGSSAYSMHSKNGDDITSPVDSSGMQRIDRDVKSRDESSSDPYEREKLLKECTTTQAEQLQPISEGLEHSNTVPSGQCSSVDSHKLFEKLAEKAELLEAREKKLVDLSRQNMDLMESNNILKNQLQQSEEARAMEMTDVNQLTDEFTKRLSDSEKRLNQAVKECDMLKKKLQETEVALVRRSDSSSNAEMLIQEKDQQISELLAEGEKLSKQQLHSNNILKKLRSKEKENDGLMKSQKEKLDALKSEVERLQKVLDNKCDVEKTQTESINQLQILIQRQEKELEKYKTEWEEAQDKVRSMQSALDSSYKEIAELHKAKVTKATEKQEAKLTSEIQAKQELQLQLDRYNIQSKQEQEALIFQIEDLRMSIYRLEKENGRREDVLRQEISDLQQRLQEAEKRNQELTSSVSAATRPLLRQIENLQSTYAAQSSSYEKTETNLTDRLSESQLQLATAQEKERVAKENLLDIESRLVTLETQLSTLRQDKSRLQAQLEMQKTKVEVLEDEKNKEFAQRETLQNSLENKLSELKKEKLLLENQLEMEKMRVEAEKKKLVLAHEQLRDKELQLTQVKISSRPTTPNENLLSRDSHDNNMIGSMTTSMSNSFLSQSGDDLERSFVFTPSPFTKTPSQGSISLYESMRNSGAASLMENLQSQLKMKDGEVVQLQDEIHELERTRESMARELVNLSNINEALEIKVKELPEAKRKYKELDQRYNAILQMYGEKTEEAQELRLDLQDVKDMYKLQIDQLLQNR